MTVSALVQMPSRIAVTSGRLARLGTVRWVVERTDRLVPRHETVPLAVTEVRVSDCGTLNVDRRQL